MATTGVKLFTKPVLSEELFERVMRFVHDGETTWVIIFYTEGVSDPRRNQYAIVDEKLITALNDSIRSYLMVYERNAIKLCILLNAVCVVRSEVRRQSSKHRAPENDAAKGMKTA